MNGRRRDREIFCYKEVCVTALKYSLGIDGMGRTNKVVWIKIVTEAVIRKEECIEQTKAKKLEKKKNV